MKIIILAAGKGERLYPLTKNTPKSLLDMGNGQVLLEEQIDRVRKSGVVDEIILVIGYLADKIEARMQSYHDANLTIKMIHNPFYDVSNNLISLWLAKEEMTSSFMVTNGDNLFAPEVFGDFVRENKDGIFLAVSRKNHYDDDDMKVTLRNKMVERLGKEIASRLIHAESPGLLLVNNHGSVNVFKNELENLVRKLEHRNSFWLETLNSLSSKGVPVQAWEFNGNTKWQEVDIHMDVEKVQKILGIGHANFTFK